jgi:6-phosphogluconolactonase
MTTTQHQLVYVGTYTRLSDDQPHRAESIYIYEFDASTGKLDFRNAVNAVINPSYLAISKDKQRLFAVNEATEFSGNAGGGVSSFTLNADSTQASFINAKPTHGTYPCYITLDSTERWALVANYGGGNVTVFPIADNGQLGDFAALIQNQGHSVNTSRQEAPHAHCVILDPSQRYVLVADLGIDQILIFRFDASNGQLTSHSFGAAEPGAGPRHLEFHPNGRYLYVINELNATVSVYDYDADNGTLKHQQTIASLPNDYTGARWAADIHITRSGQFLYVSNRAHNSITVFAVDSNNGQLTLVQTISCGGQTPRNFTLDLTDSFLLAANQESNNLVVFQIDKNSGRLTQTTTILSIPSPVCVKVISSNSI